MADLSIFIDESGDFGALEDHSPYYVLSLVFHDQRSSIEEPLSHLHHNLISLGFNEDHAIHTAPIIRRENVYRYEAVDVRKKLFNALANFMRFAPITIKGFVFDKRVVGSGTHLESAMTRELNNFVSQNAQYFGSWNRIIIYYDNGQVEVKRLVDGVFSSIANAETRLISPANYSLFQVADLVCTLKLIHAKITNHHDDMSESEKSFFSTPRVSAKKNLDKTYFKNMDNKEF